MLVLAFQASNAQVKLISATKQDWIAGAAPGRAGTTYTIKVKITTAKPVSFNKLWIGKESPEFDVQTFLKDPNKRPSKGDSLLIVYQKITKPEKRPLTDDDPLMAMELKGARIEYTAGDKKHYLAIAKFDTLGIVKGE